MDLTQLANLGEFIGGVAVLVTLIYLAVQIRQTASAQKIAAQVTAGETLRSNVNSFAAFRQMIADESTGDVWAKALGDEALTPAEMVRVRAVVNELAYSAAATMAAFRATGNHALAERVPAGIAVELEGSDVLARAWAAVSVPLRLFDFDELADGVAAQLERGQPS